MVRIGQGLAGDIPRLIPAVVILVDEQTHQLRHAKRRMGVIDMDGDLIRQIIERMILFKVLFVVFFLIFFILDKV